jgi:hypothetical protein
MSAPGVVLFADLEIDRFLADFSQMIAFAMEYRSCALSGAPSLSA